MSVKDLQPFDYNALGSVSRRLSVALFSSLPQFQKYALIHQSGEEDGLSLLVIVPSPTADPGRNFSIWVDEVSTPSIEFGASHTHEDKDDDGIEAIIAWARAIIEDQLLIIEDIGGKYPGHSSWIDLRQPQALEEELTSPYSPGRAALKSWSGNADRQVGIEDIGS